MEIIAPARWRCIDFLSDIHLHFGDHATFDTWRAYMESTSADAVFILGDLFEVWVGDDCLDAVGSFEAQCAGILGDAAKRLDLHIMAGNRDFLMGPALMHACHAVLLDDVTVLQVGSERIALAHGDALCIGDIDYQQFRKVVRGAEWQTGFLAKPLAERQAIARGMRATSESHKQAGSSYADVSTAAAMELLGALSCQHLVHGHTHRPAVHDLGGGLNRTVLSDWVSGANPQRGDVLRLELSDANVASWTRFQNADLRSD